MIVYAEDIVTAKDKKGTEGGIIGLVTHDVNITTIMSTSKFLPVYLCGGFIV